MQRPYGIAPYRSVKCCKLLFLQDYFEGDGFRDAAGFASLIVNPGLEIIFNGILEVHISGRNRAKLRIFRRGKNEGRGGLPSRY
jgi:hypothetical protein